MERYDWADESWMKADWLFERGRYVEGKQVLEDILDEEPAYGRAHAYLGWYYYYLMADFERAEVHLHYAVRFAPSYPAGYFHYHRVLMALKRYKQLLEMLNEAEKAPGIDIEWVYECRGKAYEALGKNGKAIEAYKAAALESENTQQAKRYEGFIERVKKRKQKTA